MKQVGQNFSLEAQGLVYESQLYYSIFLCLRLSTIVSVKMYLLASFSFKRDARRKELTVARMHQGIKG